MSSSGASVAPRGCSERTEGGKTSGGSPSTSQMAQMGTSKRSTNGGQRTARAPTVLLPLPGLPIRSSQGPVPARSEAENTGVDAVGRGEHKRGRTPRGSSDLRGAGAAPPRQRSIDAKVEDLRVWSKISANMMSGPYPSRLTTVTGFGILFSAVLVDFSQFDTGVGGEGLVWRWVACSALGAASLACLLAALVPRTASFACRHAGAATTAITVLFTAWNSLGAALGLPTFIMSRLEQVAPPEVHWHRLGPEMAWVTTMGFVSLSFSFVTMMMSPHRGHREDRWFARACFLHPLVVGAGVVAVFLSPPANSGLSAGDLPAAAFLFFPMALVGTVLLVLSMRPRWVAGAGEQGGRQFSLGSSMAGLPVACHWLPLFRWLSGAKQRLVKYSGVAFDAGVLLSLLVGADGASILGLEVGLANVYLLLASVCVYRFGVFVKDSAVRDLLSNILTDEGAKAVIEGMDHGAHRQGQRSGISAEEGRTAHASRHPTSSSSPPVQEGGPKPKSVVGAEPAAAGNRVAGLMTPLQGRTRTSLEAESSNVLALMSRWHAMKDRSSGVGSFDRRRRTSNGVPRKSLAMRKSSGGPEPRGVSGSAPVPFAARREAIHGILRRAETSMPPKMSIPKNHRVTAVFCDIVGYTTMSSQCEPAEVFDMLHTFFNKLDALLPVCGCFKYQTVGDAYVAIANYDGLSSSSEHAVAALQFAYSIISTAKTLQTPQKDGSEVQIRVGLHSGPLAACVLGMERPALTLIGDTINTASRMESSSLAGHVRLSDTTFDLLPVETRMSLKATRQELPVKGKGQMTSYLIRGDDLGQCEELWSDSQLLVGGSAHAIAEGSGMEDPSFVAREYSLMSSGRKGKTAITDSGERRDAHEEVQHTQSSNDTT